MNREVTVNKLNTVYLMEFAASQLEDNIVQLCYPIIYGK